MGRPLAYYNEFDPAAAAWLPALEALSHLKREAVEVLTWSRNQTVAFAIDVIGAEAAVKAVEPTDAAIAKLAQP